MSQYKSENNILEYNATSGEYVEKQSIENAVLCDEVHSGESIDLVSGVGKVLANLTGLWLVQIESSDSTATMTITVDGSSLNWKNAFSSQLSGSSIFVDADKDVTITYTALKLQ